MKHHRDKNTMIERAIDQEVGQELGTRAPRAMHDLAPRSFKSDMKPELEKLPKAAQKPLNRTATRNLILGRLRELRGDYLAAKLTQVSGRSFDYLDRRVVQLIEAEMEAPAGIFDQLEDRIVQLIDSQIKQHPTRGATLNFPPQL